MTRISYVARAWHRAMVCPAFLLLVLVHACSADRIVGSGTLPPNVVDPGLAKTPAGALAAYYGAVALMRDAWAGAGSSISPSYVVTSGEFADELKSGYYGIGLGSTGPFADVVVDSRNLFEGSSASSDQVNAAYYTYYAIAKARGQIGYARGALAAYAPDKPVSLRAHLLALEGYLELMLAEFYCSGIPLSTVDFDGDYTLTGGLTTTAVLEHAVAQFDSAIALSNDSLRIQRLAKIGKARALLNLGDYDGAYQIAQGIPDGFSFRMAFDSAAKAPGFFNLFSNKSVTIADAEGGRGLNFVTAVDARIPTATNGVNSVVAGVISPAPVLYRTRLPVRAGADSVVLGGSIEARLIEAEALLARHDPSWLTTLNALRTNGTFTTAPRPVPPGPAGAVDTTWAAGSGGIAGLQPLSAPSSDSASVDLLFRERAFWLFLTGHRQGDLRRLVRQYQRSQELVYPSGLYLGGNGQYGSDVTAPIPGAERVYPQYHGCIDRGA